MPECAQPLKFARPFEAARSRGERPDVANDPDANRSDVFVLRPYNDRVSAAAAHERIGRRRLQTPVRPFIAEPSPMRPSPPAVIDVTPHRYTAAVPAMHAAASRAVLVNS